MILLSMKFFFFSFIYLFVYFILLFLLLFIYLFIYLFLIFALLFSKENLHLFICNSLCSNSRKNISYHEILIYITKGNNITLNYCHGKCYHIACNFSLFTDLQNKNFSDYYFSESFKCLK